MVVQRASEAAIWAMPAVSVYDIELSIQRDLGGKPGDVAYFTKPMTSRHGFLTANDVTPYVTSGLSCKDDPLVVEVPPAGDNASFFGTFVDAWQTPIEDIGPSGQDKGSHAISIGFDYESSPVDDKDRTFDLPFDEIYKVSLAYGWKGNKRLDFSLGSTVYISGDAKIDQTSQGVRAKGKFDTNYVVFLGGTARYRF